MFLHVRSLRRFSAFEQLLECFFGSTCALGKLLAILWGTFSDPLETSWDPLAIPWGSVGIHLGLLGGVCEAKLEAQDAPRHQLGSPKLF